MYDTVVVRESPVLGGHSLCTIRDRRSQRNKLKLKRIT